MVSDFTSVAVYDVRFAVFANRLFLPFLVNNFAKNSNNMDDVREEWERIKLSYEILSDR